MSKDLENAIDSKKIDFEQLLQTEEELHSDLKPYRNIIRGIPWLQHPLIYSPYHPNMNALVNRQYLAKKQYIENALKEKKYNTYIWMHEKPYRWNALTEIADFLTDAEYWKYIQDVWINSENIWQSKHLIIPLLNGRNLADRSRLIMDDEDFQTYSDFSDEITVYRGCRHVNKKGLSWTTNFEIAKWFAKRFEYPGSLVIEGLVKKDSIVAYFSGRNESEVVVQSGKVKVIKQTALRELDKN